MQVFRPTLTVPQGRFLQTPQRFRAFVAGYGAGKTYIGVTSLLKHLSEYPGATVGFFGTTYGSIRDVFYPTCDLVAESWGLSIRIMESNKEVLVYRNRNLLGKIICRSMENPSSIVGYQIAHAMVDEIDTLPTIKATMAWQKIIARLRLKGKGIKNGIDVTTTPEGFKYVYNTFVKAIQLKPSLVTHYAVIQAPTRSNAKNLPEDYIPSLLATYPEQLIAAYLNGEFTNLKAGTVYCAYDRKKNLSTETINDQDTVLHIGQDFNVGNMASIVHVLRNGQPHAVDELVRGFDTPDVIRRLKERYWRYDQEQGRYIATRQLIIYPDSSGDSRKSVNASETDIQLLKTAGFRVDAPNSNPPVKDRVNSMNALFCNALGERRYFVNSDKCPTYADALEQQAWSENGEPDKDSGHDHVLDAAGYYINRKFPIIKRSLTMQECLL